MSILSRIPSARNPRPARPSARIRQRIEARIAAVVVARESYRKLSARLAAASFPASQNATLDRVVVRLLDREVALRQAIRRTGYDAVSLDGQVYIGLERDALNDRLDDSRPLSVCYLRDQPAKMITPQPSAN